MDIYVILPTLIVCFWHCLFFNHRSMSRRLRLMCFCQLKALGIMLLFNEAMISTNL